jgi:membrane fusion protein (multidrug efflux system)
MINKKILPLLALVLLTACNHGQNEPPAPAVVTQQVQTTDIINSSAYAGSVTTVEIVDILPRIQGYLLKRNFEQGQMVKTGDLLFVIEPDQYEATVKQKQADVAAAEATLAERTLNFERMKALLAKQVVAKSLYDQAESSYSNAVATLQSAKAALTNAELDLSYTQIKAPLTGRIGVTTFSPGDYLSPNTSTLATIVQLDPIRVVFSIPEQEWLAIETKQNQTPENLKTYLTPKIKLSNGTIYEYPGEISFVDNHIDATTGALAVYATFKNPDALLLPGQFVTVIIEQGKPRPALMVPSSAVLFDKKGHYVMMVNGEHKVEQRYVKTGVTQNNQIEIIEGLQANDSVIVEGLQKAIPGTLVTPTAKKAV